mgnify:CR=1 FL=1
MPLIKTKQKPRTRLREVSCGCPVLALSPSQSQLRCKAGAEPGQVWDLLETEMGPSELVSARHSQCLPPLNSRNAVQGPASRKFHHSSEPCKLDNLILNPVESNPRGFRILPR